MNSSKINFLIESIETLLFKLKEEIDPKPKTENYIIQDYDEIFNEDEE